MAQRYVVRIFHAGYGHIDRGFVSDLQAKLDDAIPPNQKDVEIDLWIDSAGGSAHATYKLWLELRERAEKLRAWIPDFAKSAATLLVLGVDEIYMAKSAELGPLDVQIEHPDKENITISALDVAGSLDYLSNFAVQLAIAGGAALITFTQLARTDILHEILPFAAQIIEPCANKIDPHLIRRAVYQLRVAEHYAQRMLQQRNIPDNKELSVEEAKKLAHSLVHDYPVHECVIGRIEAEMLGLPIFEAEKEKIWPKIKASYEGYVSSKRPLVDVVSFENFVDIKVASDGQKKENKKSKKKKKAPPKTKGRKNE